MAGRLNRFAVRISAFSSVAIWSARSGGAPDYWVIDGTIAAQNMILAARALGIGSVWLGTWPQMDRVEEQAKLFGLPATQIPHSIIAFGYPESPNVSEKQGFETDRVHYEHW